MRSSCLLAILSGLVLMGILILLLCKPLFRSYATLFSKGFGCERYGSCLFITTLERATPVILTGLSAVVAFRSGLFSIGQEWTVSVRRRNGSLAGICHPPADHLASHSALAGGMLVGAAYGWIPGILVQLGVQRAAGNDHAQLGRRARRRVPGPLPMRGDRSTTAHSPVIDQTAQLVSFMPGWAWGVGFVIAVIAVIAVYILLEDQGRVRATHGRTVEAVCALRRHPQRQGSYPCHADQRCPCRLAGQSR